MWSKRRILCVCPLTCTALALATAGQSLGQSFNKVTEAPSVHNNQTQPSSAWALCKKLSLTRVQANPSAYDIRDDLFRRSQCAL
jgi:hypothetical protein